MIHTTYECDICGSRYTNPDNGGPMEIRTFRYSQNPLGKLTNQFQDSVFKVTHACETCQVAVSMAVVSTIETRKAIATEARKITKEAKQ